MKKRGQTTIFIIIAIAIVVAISSATYLISKNREATNIEFFSGSEINPTLNSIQSKILDCGEETSKRALDTIGIQGGYYEKPRYFFDLKWTFIPYYYYEGQILNPSKIVVEKELESYVNENLDKCLETNYQNFEISFRKQKTKTSSSIKEKEVSFLIDLPIQIKKEAHTTNFELKKHEIIISSKLNDILNVADFITESHKEDKNLICISCVADMAKEKELYVDFVDFGEEKDKYTTLVVISENKTKEDPYIFEFLNNYPV